MWSLAKVQPVKRVAVNAPPVEPLSEADATKLLDAANLRRDRMQKIATQLCTLSDEELRAVVR